MRIFASSVDRTMRMGMDELDRECDVFCRYLTGHAPSAYVRAKYHSFHSSPAAVTLEPGPLDRFLVACARSRPAGARLADCYSSAARPAGLLRKKLILLVAILESVDPDDLGIEEPSSPPGWRVWFKLAASLAAGATMLVIALAVFGPMHLAAMVTFRPDRVAS